MIAVSPHVERASTRRVPDGVFDHASPGDIASSSSRTTPRRTRSPAAFRRRLACASVTRTSAPSASTRVPDAKEGASRRGRRRRERAPPLGFLFSSASSSSLSSASASSGGPASASSSSSSSSARCSAHVANHSAAAARFPAKRSTRGGGDGAENRRGPPRLGRGATPSRTRDTPRRRRPRARRARREDDATARRFVRDAPRAPPPCPTPRRECAVYLRGEGVSTRPSSRARRRRRGSPSHARSSRVTSTCTTSARDTGTDFSSRRVASRTVSSSAAETPVTGSTAPRLNPTTTTRDGSTPARRDTPRTSSDVTRARDGGVRLRSRDGGVGRLRETERRRQDAGLAASPRIPIVLRRKGIQNATEVTVRILVFVERPRLFRGGGGGGGGVRPHPRDERVQRPFSRVVVVLEGVRRGNRRGRRRIRTVTFRTRNAFRAANSRTRNVVVAVARDSAAVARDSARSVARDSAAVAFSVARGTRKESRGNARRPA